MDFKYYLSVLKFTFLNIYYRLFIVFNSFGNIKIKNEELENLAPEDYAKWVGRMVFRTSRLVNGATCLSRALAGRAALKSKGFSSTIRIGVYKDDAGKLNAHAWLLSGETTILGNEEGQLNKYKSLMDMG
jgi:hypothetical protein